MCVFFGLDVNYSWFRDVNQLIFGPQASVGTVISLGLYIVFVFFN